MKRKASSILSHIMVVLLQWTWGCLQTSLGLGLCLLSIPIWQRFHWHKSALVLRTKGRYGISLGFFILIGDSYSDSIVKHEYGHIQGAARKAVSRAKEQAPRFAGGDRLTEQADGAPPTRLRAR